MGDATLSVENLAQRMQPNQYNNPIMGAHAYPNRCGNMHYQKRKEDHGQKQFRRCDLFIAPSR